MRATVDQLLERLRSALGPDRVSADAVALAEHHIDGVDPAVLVTPESTEQIEGALRLCSESGATVIPWGGGTAMAIGNPPRQAHVVMKLDKLARVIEHDAPNLTVTAQCGLTLNALQAAVAEQKQFVPIDAPFPARATIGGIVAANLNGARRGFYGGVRDLVIGMKVVLAGGESIKAGGKVVKNVAGYDMGKLFVGSLGTLGIITEVTLKVSPAPESASTSIARGTLLQTRHFAEELSASRLLPAAVFLLGDKTGKDWRAAVWCEGFTETVDRQMRELQILAVRAGMTLETCGSEKHLALWQVVRDFPLTLDRVIYRVTVPRGTVFDYLARAAAWNSSQIVADSVIGTIWLEFSRNRTAIDRFSAIESTARELRGHAQIFSAPAALKSAINVWGASPPAFPLMREIKSRFDPDSLLNPGRFVGGL
jgi:glycolate oxidase FAD binding subunit